MKLFGFFTKGIIGFTYGISFPLTMVILDYWLKDCGISNTTIGFFAIFHIPFILKLFFAPIIDNYNIPYLSTKLGQRCSWVVLSQIALIISVLCMANIDPKNNLVLLMLMATVVATADGFQNIALFPYQISNITDDNRGYVAGIVSFGHRLGTITTKFVTLYFAHFMGWKTAYEISAILIFICMIFIINIKPPDIKDNKLYNNKPSSNMHAIQAIQQSADNSYLSIFNKLISQFQNMCKDKYGVYSVFIIFLYKASDFFIQKMSRSFCIELGFSKLEIAHIVQIFGSVSVICGGIAAGYIIQKLKIIKAMFVLCSLHTIFLFSYILLYYAGNNPAVLCCVIFLEGISGGAVASAFIAFFYDICKTGSQYAIAWAIHGIGGMFFGALSGVCVDSIGWLPFFILVPTMSIPTLLFLSFIMKKYHYSTC